MAEQKEKRIEDLNLINDWLFQEALGDEKNGNKVARLILSVLMEREIDNIIVRTQKVATSGDLGKRAIRMDVYIEEQNEDSEGKHAKAYYDLEAETEPDIKMLPKRSRLYQAIIDVRLLNAGMDFEEMKPLWIFFITPDDLFGRGRMSYTFENRCVEEPDISLEDGAKRIFLNASGTVGGKKDLSELLNYIVDSRRENATNETTKELHQILGEIRQNPERRTRYMLAIMYEKRLEERARKKGMEEGLEEGIKEGIKEGIEQGIKEGIEQGIKEGIEQGIEQGIEGSIQIAADFGASSEAIVKQLAQRYNLTSQKAQEYVEKYYPHR